MSEWPDALTQAVQADASGWLEHEPARPTGEHMWDAWYERALAAGVDAELAALGRATMREAIVGGWDDDARGESGSFDDGEAMLDLACADPESAERRWSELLETGGLAARER